MSLFVPDGQQPRNFTLYHVRWPTPKFHTQSDFAPRPAASGTLREHRAGNMAHMLLSSLNRGWEEQVNDILLS